PGVLGGRGRGCGRPRRKHLEETGVGIGGERWERARLGYPTDGVEAVAGTEHAAHGARGEHDHERVQRGREEVRGHADDACDLDVEPGLLAHLATAREEEVLVELDEATRQLPEAATPRPART